MQIVLRAMGSRSSSETLFTRGLPPTLPAVLKIGKFQGVSDARLTNLSLPALRAMAERGEIDTIILAAPDMQGRLQGKRVMPKFFFDSVAAEAAEGCAYLLATDIECAPVPGYALTSWEKGYGDFVFAPDLSDAALAPWQPGRRSCCAISSCWAISRRRSRRAPC